jgi:hypothetical protein
MTHSDPTQRGHRGLIALAIVIASALALWLATVALVRKSVSDRTADEIARLQTTGAPLTPAALDGPRPPPNEDLVAALLPRADELSKAWDWQDFALPTRGDVLPDGGEASFGPRFSAAVAAQRENLDACRRAADLPAAWLRTLAAPMSAGARDLATLNHAACALSTAALVEAWNGDGRAAAADLSRVLHIASALDRQPATISVRLQFVLVGRVHDVLRATLVRADAPAELAELDAALAALDPWRAATRAVQRERAYFVEMLSGVGLVPSTVALAPLGAPPRTSSASNTFVALFWWPSGHSMIADRLDAWASFEARAALGCPAFFRAEPAPVEPTDFDEQSFREAAAQLGRTALARAALRAHFESFAAADAFLAEQRDPFSSEPIHSRVEADGSWSAWCSASPEAPARATGPLPERDQNWRVMRR